MEKQSKSEFWMEARCWSFKQTTSLSTTATTLVHDRTSKLEDTLEKFMQASLTNQKNTEASIRNLETQVGQLAKQLSDQQTGQFSANT